MSELRSGYTTGSCALAATKSAGIFLFEGLAYDYVNIKTPLNKPLTIEVYNHKLEDEKASCFVYKDGGDDMDATHGLKIYAYLKKIKQGLVIKGGIGVGVVTRKGLKVEVNQPAINPVPRKMIIEELERIKTKYNYQGGLEVEIVVPDGKIAATKTFNQRLGIEGGISILGTTGIVEPMSERALVETIKVEIDYYIENAKSDIMVLSPGNYGQDFARNELLIDIEQAIKYSNFLGECLDYSHKKGIKKILIVSHIGKLVKVAGAIMNTHSKYADARNEIYCAHAGINGVKQALLQEIMNANTSLEIDEILETSNKRNVVYQSIAQAIQDKIDYRVNNQIQVEFIGFTNEKGVLVESKNALEYLKKLKEDHK